MIPVNKTEHAEASLNRTEHAEASLIVALCFLKGVGHVLPTRSVQEHTETCMTSSKTIHKLRVENTRGMMDKF